ncbi:MAG TPA: PTS transporter subunit EIIC, partial [Halanaerobiales bacterium]|nr:PTS transporter subunit EIIC [Halanaerobiales bacterium]
FMVYLFGPSWKIFGSYIYNGTFAIISPLIVFSVSYNLARSYNFEPLLAGVTSFSSFMILLLESEGLRFTISFEWLNAAGLFAALIVALTSTEILVHLMQYTKKKGKIQEGMTPVLTRSFAALLPTALVLALFSFLKIFFLNIGVENPLETLYNIFQAPLAGMANTLGSALVIVFLSHLFWFLGLHGSNILEPVIQAMYIPALQENIVALTRGTAVPNIITKPFLDTFVYMGGCGTTLSLLIAFFIFSRKKRFRELVRLTSAQGFFNINEPVVYGLPVVMNPIFLIPFIMTPVVLTITSYLATVIGLVPRTVAMVPWSTPPIISGFLVTGSLMGSVLQLVNLLIGVLIYLPFMIMAEKAKDIK